jgi:hypothetical protein
MLRLMGIPATDGEVRAPDIDEAGVDRAQIRAMLRLTPEQRLRQVSDFVESLYELREQNARPPR